MRIAENRWVLGGHNYLCLRGKEIFLCGIKDHCNTAGTRGHWKRLSCEKKAVFVKQSSRQYKSSCLWKLLLFSNSRSVHNDSKNPEWIIPGGELTLLSSPSRARPKTERCTRFVFGLTRFGEELGKERAWIRLFWTKNSLSILTLSLLSWKCTFPNLLVSNRKSEVVRIGSTINLSYE